MCGGLRRTTVGGGGEFGENRSSKTRDIQQIPPVPAPNLQALVTLMKQTRKDFPPIFLSPTREQNYYFFKNIPFPFITSYQLGIDSPSSVTPY